MCFVHALISVIIKQFWGPYFDTNIMFLLHKYTSVDTLTMFEQVVSMLSKPPFYFKLNKLDIGNPYTKSK